MGLTSEIEIAAALEALRSHNLSTLFTQHLEWLEADTHSPTQISGQACLPVAQRDSVVVWHVPLTSKTNFAPTLRHQIYQALSAASSNAPLVIFVAADKHRSLWCQSLFGSALCDSALYVVGQPMYLWLSRLQRFARDTKGLFPRMERRVLQDETFERLVQEIEQGIAGIKSASDRQQYSLLIFQRLIFLQQLQKKGWLDGDVWYLQTRFGRAQGIDFFEKSSQYFAADHNNRFFHDCLQPLFRALSLPAVEQPAALKETVGDVPAIGLFFQKDKLEEKYDAITIEDSAFENVLGWLSEQASAGTLNPWIDGSLGYWLERYWRRRIGITPAEVGRSNLSKVICEQTLDRLLLERLTPFSKESSPEQTLNDLLFEASPQVYRQLIQEILPSLRMVDPYCGSGQLLVAFHQQLSDIYSLVTGYIQQTQDKQLKIWHQALAERPATQSLAASEKEDTGVVFKNIQERVLKNTIFGVAATVAIAQSARFLLLLHFIGTAQTPEDVESLIDLDFNVMAGDALVGFIKVDEERFDRINTSSAGSVFQGNLLQPLAADSYQTILDEKNIALEYYQSRSQTLAQAHSIPSYARAALLREEILTLDQKAQKKLDNLLLSHMSQQLSIRYPKTQLAGRPLRRPLTIEDIQGLNPFHCGYYFNAVIRQGGFDIVVCMPPSGAFKPTAAEFLLQHRDLVEREGLTSKTLKTSKQALKQMAPDVAQAWLRYQDDYACLTNYFEQSERYLHQRSNSGASTERRKSRYPFNRAMLFVEQCFNLLADKGYGGVMIPSELCIDERVRSLLIHSSVSIHADEAMMSNNEPDREVSILSWVKSLE